MNKKKNKGIKKNLRVLDGEGKRFSFSSLKRAILFYVMLLVALVVIVQIGYHWLGDQFLAWRLQVIEAKPGIMQQETTVKGIVTRGEEVIRSPASGVVLSLAGSGERVATGNELFTIGVLSKRNFDALQGSEEEEPDDDLWEQVLDYWQIVFPEDQSTEEPSGEADLEPENDVAVGEEPENENAGLSEPPEEKVGLPADTVFEELIIIRSERAGFLSHYSDGWEDYEGPTYLSGEDSEGVNPEGSFTVEGDLVETGDPIVKIVDNWHWHFNVILPLHPGRIIAAMETISLEFSFAPAEPVVAKRVYHEVNEEKQEVWISYLIEKQLVGFDQIRSTEASLLYHRQQGIIVPAEALFEKDHAQGVYLSQGGRVVFQPVTVIERQEENVMVEGVAPYSLVISRPDLVEEGQRLN